jgi:hypothetical protein
MACEQKLLQGQGLAHVYFGEAIDMLSPALIKPESAKKNWKEQQDALVVLRHRRICGRNPEGRNPGGMVRSDSAQTLSSRGYHTVCRVKVCSCWASKISTVTQVQ